MAGCGDKKIYQWDSDTGDLVQVCSTALCLLLCSSCHFASQLLQR